MTDTPTPTSGMPLSSAGSAQAAANFQPVMEHVIDLYESLETRYERLRLAYASLMQAHLEVSSQLHALQHPTLRGPKLTEGSFITDAAGTILSVNAAFTSITGYSAEEAVGKNPRFMQSGLQDTAFYRDFWRELNSAGTWQGQIFNRRKSGDIFPEWIRISQTKDGSGAVLCNVAVMVDLSGLAPQEVLELSKSEPAHVYRTQPAPDAA